MLFVCIQVLSGLCNEAFEDSMDGQKNTTYQETHFDEPKDVDEVPGRDLKGPLTVLAAADRTIDFNNSRESSMI